MNFVPLRRRVVVAATLAALAGLSAGALYLRPSSAETKPAAAEPRPTPVPVATVVQSDVAMWDEFSGRLEAVERVDLRSRVAGAVQSVHFVEGALVKRDDLLVTIDPAPYAAEVERAQAQVVAAQARVTYTKSEHERAQRLWNESAIARRELDERVNAQQEADANLRAAEAALLSARLNLGYTQVRAPVSGRVGRLEITVGNLVAAGPGAPVLTTLVSVNPIYASFDADERVVLRALKDLTQGIPVEMETAGGTTHRGRLQLIDNQVNARSGTVRVRAVFDNKDGSLIPGQFAKLRMGQAKTEPALLVSERAVGTDQNKRYVMVVGEDNKAAYRPIFAGVLSVLTFLGGMIALRLLPISEYPEVVPPSIVVRANYPGANPKVIAETVATPLEEQINGVEGMLYMSSQATSDGRMTLTVTFKLGTDPDLAQQKVQNRVAQAEPRLPEEVRRLGVTTVKSAVDFTMVVHLVSPSERYDVTYLRNYALLNVKDRLARVQGVGQVLMWGGGDYAMRVWLDPRKVAERGLSANDVVRAIREQNVQAAAGVVGGSPTRDRLDLQLSINAQGRLATEEDFADIIVKSEAG